MPELPDIVVYLDALEQRIVGQPLQRVRVVSPFVLRSVDPPLSAIEGRTVGSLGRLGKRIVIGFEERFFLVFHLMIAGRLRWRDRAASAESGRTRRGPGASKPVAAAVAVLPRKIGLASFEFPNGTLLFTEAGKKKRASLHVVHGDAALAEHDPGGLDVIGSPLEAFREVLTRENHTLKRAFTDPRLFSGIGNAYSDEILHRARLSPLKLTRRLLPEEIDRLHVEAQAALLDWIDRLRREAGARFPEKVTAFRDEMAVHGRFGRPCPVCGSPVQRIAYAENEANYCASCQTGGKLLADRSLSRLLRADWPRTVEEMEQKKRIKDK